MTSNKIPEEVVEVLVDTFNYLSEAHLAADLCERLLRAIPPPIDPDIEEARKPQPTTPYMGGGTAWHCRRRDQSVVMHTAPRCGCEHSPSPWEPKP